MRDVERPGCTCERGVVIGRRHMKDKDDLSFGGFRYSMGWPICLEVSPSKDYYGWILEGAKLISVTII